MESEKIWFDGELVDFKDAQVHVLTHSLHYGLGAFEGIRCYERADGRRYIFRLREHIQRLFESCKICLMDLPYTVEELESACVETVQANSFQDCYLRPLAFLGHGKMGLSAVGNKTHVAIATWDWGAYLGEEGLNNGIRAKVSSFTRQHINSSMVKGKITGQYVNSILAKREVMNAGYDEAIMLDGEGFVSEASGENIFVVYRGRVLTTPTGASILAGITRDTVMQLLGERDIEVVETRFSRDMLYTADEIFMSGTAAEITPVREVDDRQIGDGQPGPITKLIQEAYFDLVRGSSDAHPEWLTLVE
ncbi:branched-chain amino acid transaminase [Bradymonas sediminis]|uniref:Branched-chain-amino-acid aminotransferase n=1 Tax=Bradymonas sediminis TaxID=1548548 RepID=A0A2Z4FQW4_9DELT|nr:branched chain amino acid aminotransferase [Bradymonas sediminis]